MTLKILMVAAGVLALGAAAWAAEPTDNWYVFHPDGKLGKSVIGMADWLDSPAGRTGPVHMDRDRLVRGDGTPIKFWGVNVAGSNCVPTHEEAEYWAQRFADYGINCVRLHKPWDDLFADDDSTALKPDAVERLDYFCNQLQKHGICYTWSLFYHHRLKGKDLAKLRHPDEYVKATKGNLYGVADYLPDVQQIMIDAATNLLKHENPYTGHTYADDPALAMVEFQNEASIMFWSGTKLVAMPDYQREFSARFAAWLKDKYGSEEKLKAAWGDKAWNAFDYKDESLAEGRVWVVTKATTMNAGGLEDAASKGLKQRMLDNAAFLHEAEDEYYGRFGQAVRDTGYKGCLIGSCWRAQGGITEYYNLESDAAVGVIDRHNYHGGLSGWKPRTGDTFGNKAQVNEPGGGLLSSSFMQVAGHPFSFSEWATVFPNEYVLESPAILSAYGMGLQGWDASFQFAARTSGTGYTKGLQTDGMNLWNVDRPENLGLYPAIARMIYRGDLDEGPVISSRRISPEDLQRGVIPWGDESYSGWHDLKVYKGPMPGASLAVGRVLVEFVRRPQESVLPDLSRHEHDGVIRSFTGQLTWDVSRPDKGFFTINSAGTKAVVGFRPDEPQKLLDVTIDVKSPAFSAVYVTSLDRTEAVDRAKRVLITVMARAQNTGMRFNDARDKLEDLGQPPIRLEPVRGSVTFMHQQVAEVRLLDHDGRETGRVRPGTGNTVTFDGAQDQTPYYEVIFQ